MNVKLVIAYIRTECAAQVMRELYEAGVGGITAYAVHGIRANVINEDVYEKNR
jgi:nitrogen regulatory protein PII